MNNYAHRGAWCFSGGPARIQILRGAHWCNLDISALGNYERGPKRGALKGACIVLYRLYYIILYYIIRGAIKAGPVIILGSSLQIYRELPKIITGPAVTPLLAHAHIASVGRRTGIPAALLAALYKDSSAL